MEELEIIQYPKIAGLSVFFDTVDYRTPHVHPAWELLWILDGSLSVTCGGVNHVVNPGELILFNPNELHEFRKIKGSVTFLCLQVSSEALQGSEALFVDEKLPHQHLSSAEQEEIKGRIKEIMAAYLKQEEHYALTCIGQSCLVFHRLFHGMPTHKLTQGETENMDKRGARLRRLIRFVDENYMRKIRLADFAREEGCSMNYLSRFIKESLNQTFQDYVASVRFNCACKLMEEGERKMLDVCVESGFSDYRYFCREFRRQCGMTPEGYSRIARRPNEGSGLARRSIHSVERFYSREESLTLIEKYM